MKFPISFEVNDSSHVISEHGVAYTAVFVFLSVYVSILRYDINEAFSYSCVYIKLLLFPWLVLGSVLSSLVACTCSNTTRASSM